MWPTFKCIHRHHLHRSFRPLISWHCACFRSENQSNPKKNAYTQWNFIYWLTLTFLKKIFFSVYIKLHSTVRYSIYIHVQNKPYFINIICIYTLLKIHCMLLNSIYRFNLKIDYSILLTHHSTILDTFFFKKKNTTNW